MGGRNVLIFVSIQTTKEDIKNIIENISKLKSDIQHDKGFTLLTGEGKSGIFDGIRI